MPYRTDEPPFLATDPPHWVARGLWYWLAIIAAVGAAALVFVSVPETVSGRFTLVPERGVDPIRARRGGLVSAVHGVEGQPVDSGTVLFTVRSSITVDRGSELRSLEAAAAADSAALRLARSRRETLRCEQRSEERRLIGKLDYLERRVASTAARHALARSVADSAAVGLRRGVVSRIEYSRLEYEAVEYADQLDTARREIDETQADLSRLADRAAVTDLEYEQTTNRLDAALSTAAVRIMALRSDLDGTAGTDLLVSSPCDGTLLRMHVAAPGAIVDEGGELAEIACVGRTLRGEIVLPESGVALVRPGQHVRLRLDAFPWQRFGVRFGTVQWIGPSATTGQGTRTFRALLHLPDSAVIVHGEPRTLLPGMGGRADILTGERRLIGFVFEPIRSLRERYARPPR
jgi:membrane fusion protein